jgi:protein ImuB
MCGPEANRQGLHIGQPLAEAKALLPRAVFLADDVDADRAALAQLALDCQRFSPLVGLEEGPNPQSLLADATGCTDLWHGEERFLEAVCDYWRGRGYHVQLALACSIGSAWALAHTAAISLVPPGGEEAALAGLSVALLRLPPEVLDRLDALGLWTIGDVLRLPRESLASRFGAILPERLDQVLGLLPETLICERLNEPLKVRREWETPIDDRLTLTYLCRQMLHELLALVNRYGMGLHELAGELQTETETETKTETKTETGPVPIEIRLVEPTQDESHLAQLVELQLERQTWTGGVIAIEWTARRLGRLQQAQGRLFDDDDAGTKTSRSFNTLVDRLTSRLEAKSVLRAEFHPDAQPEYAARLVPWTSADLPASTSASASDRFRFPPEQSRGRPCRLLGVPRPIEVASLIPDGPPLCMVWEGQAYMVVRSWGPERIATGWWRSQDIERDYYRAEWEGGTQVWVYCDRRDGRWFLHGFFD